MPGYEPPLRDYRFVLHEVLKIQDETEIAGLDELTEDVTAVVLGEAGRLASDVLEPLNRIGDIEGCRLENGVVRTPTGFPDAWAKLVDGGWPSLECDPAHGGQGMPAVLNFSVGTIQTAANMALMMYQGLTHGAYSAIRRHGTEEQKRLYLPKLASGEWTGTMNLTEPQCGTDLGLLRTRAVPQDDGSFRLTGQKIFISSGEHDLTGNIIHLVLARLPDAPEGTRGISLFVVPKVLVNADGSLGERNAVTCGKVEEKMGIHGNATCVMNYDGATGWLVGEPNKGLARHVHDDERGAPAGRHAGAGRGAGRQPAGRRLCPRSPAGPRRDGRAEPGGAGRSADRRTRTCAGCCWTRRASSRAASASSTGSACCWTPRSAMPTRPSASAPPTSWRC